MISLGNLTHNLNLIIQGLKASTKTRVVSWLPQYHDMGLIGSYLALLYCGGSGYYFSPLTFIRNPTLWIQGISKFRGTHMQAPNFAYGLTARKFMNALSSASTLTSSRKKSSNNMDWISTLDLSCVEHMINAGMLLSVLFMVDVVLY